MQKKICLITPGHLSTNPRLVKEAVCLANADFKVHVIFTQYMDYLVEEDQKILLTHPNISFNALNWTKAKPLNRILSALLQKACSFLSKKHFNQFHLNKIILNRNYYWQYRKAYSTKAHLYIAHNIGALSVAADAAKKVNAKFAFDAEDFHLGEDVSELTKKCISNIESNYLKKASYVTYASPLIGKQYQLTYPNLSAPIIINNVFQKDFLNIPRTENIQGLKLFWFSQTIGKARGLEDVIKAIGLIKNAKISLTLLGSLNKSDTSYFRNLAEKSLSANHEIIFLPPVAPEEVFRIAAQADIGLALERNIPLNRDICLTNKLFTYLLSGIAVIASDTSAQKQFLTAYPKIGHIYTNGNVDELASAIQFFLNNKKDLYEAKVQAYLLAKERFNWEIESLSLLNTINFTFEANG